MAKSKLDAYRGLLGDMTDEKLVELTGYKMVTVQKYRAKHAAQLEEAIAEVSDLTGVAPDELEEAPEGEDAAEEVPASESEPEAPPAPPAPKSFATKRTVVITRNGGTMKIGMSEFFGERAAAVWAMLSEDDRRDLTKNHVY